MTIRAGQFVKPFGFEVQQPDAVRESPERAMFAGYVFPGERDRGVMLLGNVTATCTFFAAGILRPPSSTAIAFSGTRTGR